MRAKTEKERRLWIAAGLLLLAIYASAYFVQHLLDALRERNLLRLSIGATFGLVAAGLALALARAGARWRTLAMLSAGAVLYTATALGLEVIQERIHLLQYGVVAVLCAAALAARGAADPGCGFRSAPAVASGAFALAFAAGLADELLQGLLPNRHYDLRDVGLNALSAAMALLMRAALHFTLRLDRAARRAP